MATFHFDLVSPEKLLFSGEVNQVDVPGSEGDFAEVGPGGLTVLADMAVPVEEFDVTQLAGVIKDTEEDVADEKDDWTRDKLAQKLDRLRALQAALGA